MEDSRRAKKKGAFSPFEILPFLQYDDCRPRGETKRAMRGTICPTSTRVVGLRKEKNPLELYLGICLFVCLFCDVCWWGAFYLLYEYVDKY